jgi:hypothetical protein
MRSLSTWGKSQQDTEAGSAGLSGLAGALSLGRRRKRVITRMLKGGRSIDAAIRIPNSNGSTLPPGTGALLRSARDHAKASRWAEIAELLTSLESDPRPAGLGPRRAQAVASEAISAGRLESLTERQTADPDNPMLSTLLALALLDREEPDAAALADTVLQPHDAIENMSPLLAEAHLRLLFARDGDIDDIRSAFEDWSDLDPRDLAVFKAAGQGLFQRFGTVALLNEAAQAADRTRDMLGQGAYAAMALQTIGPEVTRMQEIDTARFLTGLGDLFRRGAEQGYVNRVASRISEVIFDPAPLFGRGDTELSELKQALRPGLKELMRRHLRTVDPGAWAHGREQALDMLADLFEEELATGAILRFTACGLLVDGPARDRA